MPRHRASPRGRRTSRRDVRACRRSRAESRSVATCDSAGSVSTTMVLTGFYADDRVIPIDQAAEAYSERGRRRAAPALDRRPARPPPARRPVVSTPSATLSAWVDGLDEDEPRRAGDPGRRGPSCSCRSPARRKLLLLAGNYAEHVAERGGIAAERARDVPLRLHEAADDHPDPPRRPDRHAPRSRPTTSTGSASWASSSAGAAGDVDEDEALDYVAGYTVVNDISDRKFTPNPGRKPRERDKFFDWLHGKWHDTFCPMGPCILSADAVARPPGAADPPDGQRRGQAGRARRPQMVFPVAAVIAFLSRFVTLEPGDVIATGHALGRRLGDRDLPQARRRRRRASIERIGTLENPVEAEDGGRLGDRHPGPRRRPGIDRPVLSGTPRVPMALRVRRRVVPRRSSTTGMARCPRSASCWSPTGARSPSGSSARPTSWASGRWRSTRTRTGSRCTGSRPTRRTRSASRASRSAAT